jgi:hypothetical protein
MHTPKGLQFAYKLGAADGSIYQRAKEVAVWLDLETNTTLKAFETLYKIVTILREKSWASSAYS